MELEFIGLGNMGRPMALNLLKAGHSVKVFDLSAPAVEEVVRAGGMAAANPREVASGADVVMTSLPTPAVVEAVYLGENGMLLAARPGQVYVDLSSVTPAVSQKVAIAFAEAGASVLDAPVSGGTSGAAAGTLTLMVGGDKEVLDRVEPVLKAIGQKIFYVGPSGSGSTTKVLHQLLMGVNTMAVVEVLALGKKAGLDLDQFSEIVGVSAGFSKVFQSRFNKGRQGDYAPGFAIDLMAKDMRLVMGLAKDLGIELEVSPQALKAFEKAGAQGLGGKDVVAAVELYAAEA